jgi:hypothetical protein
MSVMVFQNIPFFGEGSIAYLYVRTRYGWEVEEFSQYSSTISTARLVGEKWFDQVLIYDLYTDTYSKYNITKLHFSYKFPALKSTKCQPQMITTKCVIWSFVNDGS